MWWCAFWLKAYQIRFAEFDNLVIMSCDNSDTYISLNMKNLNPFALI